MIATNKHFSTYAVAPNMFIERIHCVDFTNNDDILVMKTYIISLAIFTNDLQKKCYPIIY